MSRPSQNRSIPLAERMRPENLEDMVGQDHLLGPGEMLRTALESGRMFSVIFWGPPGSGKTTLARLIARYTRSPYRAFSAVTSGIKDLREILAEAEKTKASSGRSTILFVDEIHRFNKAQQDAFLPHVESGLLVLIGATTQNPSFEVIPPLLSRSRVLTLKPLGREAILILLRRALADPARGFGDREIEVGPDALDLIIELAQGDARAALNSLEEAVYFASAEEKDVPLVIHLGTVEKAVSRKALPYDKEGEEHYNLISAFHKSLRGSDPQASLYWLYRMLMAGEDPLFIARRMIRFASEDVGMADPHALQIALAAFDAWERIGPPEGELALAQAAAYLAYSPKSNSLYLAEKTVKEEIERSGALPVPLHIRNAPTALMKKLGYGKGYLYPHNFPGAWVEQEYLPEEIRSRLFYRPSERGYEGIARKRMRPRGKG